MEGSDGKGMAGGSYVPTLPNPRLFLARMFRMEGYTYANAEAAADAYLASLEAMLDGSSDDPVKEPRHAAE